MSLVYGIEVGAPVVTLTDDAIGAMLRHRQMKSKDPEAGGQLFARFEENGTATIVEATGPKPKDKRSRCLFIPDRWLQRAEIKVLHEEGKHFVGDWHTHPEAIPSPSGEDVAGMIDCFRKSRHELQAFIMIIIGTAEPPEGIYVGLVDGDGVRRLDLLAKIP